MRLVNILLADVADLFTVNVMLIEQIIMFSAFNNVFYRARKENTFALARVLWLYDPGIILFLEPGGMEMSIEVSEFIRQNIRFRYNIKCFFAVLFLHFDDVCDETILAGQFI